MPSRWIHGLICMQAMRMVAQEALTEANQLNILKLKPFIESFVPRHYRAVPQKTKKKDIHRFDEVG